MDGGGSGVPARGGALASLRGCALGVAPGQPRHDRHHGAGAVDPVAPRHPRAHEHYAGCRGHRRRRRDPLHEPAPGAARPGRANGPGCSEASHRAGRSQGSFRPRGGSRRPKPCQRAARRWCSGRRARRACRDRRAGEPDRERARGVLPSSVRSGRTSRTRHRGLADPRRRQRDQARLSLAPGAGCRRVRRLPLPPRPPGLRARSRPGRPAGGTRESRRCASPGVS